MNQPQSVSSLNNQIKSLLETTFIGVYVEGEVSNLTYHNSGHIYFSVKDKTSTVSCVMFRGNAQYLKFRLEMGMKITISGSITVYTPRGNYQLLCNKIEPSGQGALALAYEQLKEKLQEKGYFETSIKKQLPKYPKHIVLVTSPTGAAIEDMKKVATHRWPLTKITLIPALVQGEGSKEDIVKAINLADTLNADILVVGRGGGSIEDLWAFNEEVVATAIYEAHTPVISAVGHEVDFLISDFVADVRAATPSNAIEMALPDVNEHRMYLDNLANEFNNRFKTTLLNKEQHLSHTKKLFEQHSFSNKFTMMKKEIEGIKNNFNSMMNTLLNHKAQELKFLCNSYETNHPNKRNKEGYAQITRDNKIINLKELKKDEIISLETAQNIATCRVIENKNI